MQKLLLALFGVILGAATVASMPAEAKPPQLTGSWDIALCENPERGCVLVEGCYQFTRVPGTVNGMPLSGTWTLTGFLDNGRWVQYGDTVHFFATYDFGGEPAYIVYTGVLNGPKRLGGISWVDDLVSAPDPRTGTWFGTKRRDACPVPGNARPHQGRIGSPR